MDIMNFKNLQIVIGNVKVFKNFNGIFKIKLIKTLDYFIELINLLECSY